MVASAVAPEPGGAPSPAPLVDWDETRRFLRAIGRFESNRIVLALFPESTDSPCIHLLCSGDALPDRTVRREFMRPREPGQRLALGMVVNEAAPQPSDWGTKLEHFSGKPEEQQRRWAEFNGHSPSSPYGCRPKRWGASNAHISRVVGGFAECDGALVLEAQRELPELAQLPPPSLIVFTGGKSLHFYWLLGPGEELPLEWFRRLQKALPAAIDAVAPQAKADKGIHNAARIMRIPGGLHPKTGNRCRIELEDGPRYTAAELIALIEEIEARTGTKPKAKAEPTGTGLLSSRGQSSLSGDSWFDRLSREEQERTAAEMLGLLPKRGEPGSGTYNDAFATLCSLVDQFGEEGALLVINLAGWHSPNWDVEAKIADVSGSTRRGIGSLIHDARAAGWQHPNNLGGRLSASSGVSGVPLTTVEIVGEEDALPPGPSPERRAEIEAELEALAQKAEILKAETSSPETLAEVIADLAERKVRWPGHSDEIEAVAKDIGRGLAAHALEGKLDLFKDKLAAAVKIGKKPAMDLLKEAFWAFEEEMKALDQQVAALLAERDAREHAIAEREKQAQHSQREDAERQKLAQLAGLDAVVFAAGEGWKFNELTGEMKHTRLHPGTLAGQLIKKLGSRLGFNEMTLLPALDGDDLPPDRSDKVYVDLNHGGWIAGKEETKDAITRASYENCFHPIQLYLKGVEADDTIEPIDLEEFYSWFHVSDPLQQSFLRLMLLGATWRAMEPGCALKLCVILVSKEQTFFKSLALERLCGKQWFSDTHHDQDKDLLLAIHGSWFHELGEIDKLFASRHAGALKNLVSPSSDFFRPPYASTPARFARSSIFVGTSNRTDFLTDDTGSHRYPIVEITRRINVDAIEGNRDRIWKAALGLYRSGEKPWLSTEQLAASEARNENFTLEHPWLGLVECWVRGASFSEPGSNQPVWRQAPADGFDTATALVQSGCVREGQTHAGHAREMAKVLKLLGFEQQRQKRVKGRVARQWRRPSVTDATPVTDAERGICDVSVTGQNPVPDSLPLGVSQMSQMSEQHARGEQGTHTSQVEGDKGGVCVPTRNGVGDDASVTAEEIAENGCTAVDLAVTDASESICDTHSSVTPPGGATGAAPAAAGGPPRPVRTTHQLVEAALTELGLAPTATGAVDAVAAHLTAAVDAPTKTAVSYALTALAMEWVAADEQQSLL